jgi:hypothetical protein
LVGEGAVYYGSFPEHFAVDQHRLFGRATGIVDFFAEHLETKDGQQNEEKY